MKSLYNSLKPEYQDKLEVYSKEYPVTIESIKKAFYYNELWSCLTVSQVRDFISFTDQTFGTIAYYDWSYGDKFLIPNSNVNEFTNSKQ